MPDPIPHLDDLAAEAKEASMLPANEIRRRGDRRRIVRRIGTTLAVASIGLGVGVGTYAIAPQFRDGAQAPQYAATPAPTPVPADDSDAGSPTPETRPSAPEPPTWANVPTVDLMYPYDSSIAEQTGEHEGPAGATFGLCDPGSWGDPGTTLVREFGVDGVTYEYAIVFGYPDADSASAGYDLLTDAARNCDDRILAGGFDRADAQELEGMPFDEASVDGSPARAAYFTAMAANDGEDLGMFSDTLLVQSGERVAWLVTTFEGMDNNCSVAPDQDAMQCELAYSLPQIADLLDD